jgi:hypothetical protein
MGGSPAGQDSPTKPRREALLTQFRDVSDLAEHENLIDRYLLEADCPIALATMLTGEFMLSPSQSKRHVADDTAIAAYKTQVGEELAKLTSWTTIERQMLEHEVQNLKSQLQQKDDEHRKAMSELEAARELEKAAIQTQCAKHLAEKIPAVREELLADFQIELKSEVEKVDIARAAELSRVVATHQQDLAMRDQTHAQDLKDHLKAQLEKLTETFNAEIGGFVAEARGRGQESLRVPP